MHSAWQGH
jgi:hypothetical protein